MFNKKFNLNCKILNSLNSFMKMIFRQHSKVSNNRNSDWFIFFMIIFKNGNINLPIHQYDSKKKNNSISGKARGTKGDSYIDLYRNKCSILISKYELYFPF